jgi:hypothetical protein
MLTNKLSTSTAATEPCGARSAPCGTWALLSWTARLIRTGEWRVAQTSSQYTLLTSVSAPGFPEPRCGGHSDRQTNSV